MSSRGRFFDSGEEIRGAVVCFSRAENECVLVRFSWSKKEQQFVQISVFAAAGFFLSSERRPDLSM